MPGVLFTMPGVDRRSGPGQRRFTVLVQAVIGLGIKVAWSREDLDRAQAAAHRPPVRYGSRDETAVRYLRMSVWRLPPPDLTVEACGCQKSAWPVSCSDD